MDVKILLPILVLLCATSTKGANILIFPYDIGFNSRLMNLVKIAEMFYQNGHNTTILLNSKVDHKINPGNSSLLVYQIKNKEKVKLITDDEAINKMISIPKLGPLEVKKLVDYLIDMQSTICQNLLGSDLLKQIKRQQFDLVITDSLSECGKIVVDYLDIPTMGYSNWGFIMDPNVFYPYIPSFMCTAGLPACSSSQMTFSERMQNAITIFSYLTITGPYTISRYDALKNEYGLNVTRSLSQSVIYKSMVIVNGDFVLDYPRPLMPNVIMVGGIFNKNPKPLPAEYEEFIANSAPHGIVVVSFGSLVAKVEKGKAEIMARVFGRLKQRVIWRFSGETPQGLKNNTKLVGWFPQSDVLAHPLTKMFVTHCGISGTYEAAFNGLPVVAMPLFADQKYNAKKLVERGGMGIHLSLDDLTEEDFEHAVHQTLNNETYRENAKQVSSLLKDHQTNPKEKLMYWVDFVIRHKGARHLISETALNMGLFKYASLDVISVIIGFLTVALLVFTFIIYILFCLLQKVFRISKLKSD